MSGIAGVDNTSIWTLCMERFKIGEQVRVVHTLNHGRIGKIKDIVPNLTDEERFQPYLVEFTTETESIAVHYFQYELRRPLEANGTLKSILTPSLGSGLNNRDLPE